MKRQKHSLPANTDKNEHLNSESDRPGVNNDSVIDIINRHLCIGIEENMARNKEVVITDNENSGGKGKLFMIIGTLILLAGGGGAGFYYMNLSGDAPEDPVSSTEANPQKWKLMRLYIFSLRNHSLCSSRILS